MKKLDKNIYKIWDILQDFYNVKLTMIPRVIIVKNDEFGTRDKTVCGKDVLLLYCPDKLKQELRLLDYNKSEFDKYLIFALSECLSMSFQKIVNSKKCQKQCQNCRLHSKNNEFRLLNYVINYYIADYATFKIFGIKQFSINKILKKLSDNNSKLILSLLKKIYSLPDPDKEINDIARKKEMMFSDVVDRFK